MRSLLLCALLLAACGGTDPDLVRRLDERIEHLEESARIQEASYERQIADLEEKMAEVTAENAILRERVETLVTVSGAEGSIERHLGMLDRQLAACHEAVDRVRTDLDRCLAGE